MTEDYKPPPTPQRSREPARDKTVPDPPAARRVRSTSPPQDPEPTTPPAEARSSARMPSHFAPPSSPSDRSWRLLQKALRDRDVNRVMDHAWPLFHDELLGFACSRGFDRESAEDIVQAVFGIAFTQFPLFNNVHFRGWLYSILRYELRSRRKRHHHRRALESERGMPHWANHSQPPGVRDLEAQDLLLDALSHESELDTEIYVAAFHDDLDDEAIARRILNRFEEPITLAAIRNRKSRIRKRLVDHIETHLSEQDDES